MQRRTSRKIPRHRTQIVATVGPASESPRVLRALIQSGVDIFRLNTSHGTAAEHLRRIQRLRAAGRRLKQRVSILIDLPGPKFRLANLPRGTAELRVDQRVRLTAPGARGDGFALPLRHPDLLARLRPNDLVFLNDGTVKLVVLQATKTSADCRVETGGTVRSGSGLNLPSTDLGLQLPTDKDKAWIRFAAAHGAEWLAVSFVQSPDDVAAIRAETARYGYRPKIMAKIEKRRALENLEHIIRAADAVMVARGDLGVETPLEEIAFAQKRIIATANRQEKFVVTATQMLESMVTQPNPTRAEVTDIANAVIDGTDAVMLSAESAIGRYPIEAVATLGRVLSAAEAHLRGRRSHRKIV